MELEKVIDKFLTYMEGIDRSVDTIKLYRRDLRYTRQWIEKEFGRRVDIDEITADTIENFMRHLKVEKNYSPCTRSRFFYTLRSIYKYAYKKEIVKRNVAATVDFIRMPKREREFLGEEDVFKLIKAVKNPLIKLVTEFLFYTGLRISECLKLKLEDVDLDNKIIMVRMGKGNKDRVVPINQKLYLKLLSYSLHDRKAINSPYFFATKKSGKLSICYVDATLKNAAEKLGWKRNVSCHIIRHSFATCLLRRNVSLVYIQKLLGHSSLAVTSVYLHSDYRDLAEAVNRL